MKGFFRYEFADGTIISFKPDEVAAYRHASDENNSRVEVTLKGGIKLPTCLHLECFEKAMEEALGK